ncbi:AGC/AKT protein kinase [Aphanomyces invadans]|uniref:AGC/AKT protein kinase n=1 Tax=Aphanomyces invadans TaxID=157072 RepID=A0A024U6F3_9STRA|nr:AGC/AKT protein kinase [Aphanomyces invadans]ETW01800.1 AGC/AKT protein kinase [Aphanomyces invadans]|eukprot:XP_008869648.1 AGC/AKT protein kinase [Aphanomyces invadans]
MGNEASQMGGSSLDMSSRNMSSNSLADLGLESMNGRDKYHTDANDKLESLDLQAGLDWEGFVQKKGHLVRNWKVRYFTLEGNLLSYYETKEDARKRRFLKGRVHLTTVMLVEGRSAHGYDLTFTTQESKPFHVSTTTELEQIAWVKAMEAGIDFYALNNYGHSVYGSSLLAKSIPCNAEIIYSLYRRMLANELSLFDEFISYFNKDLVFTSHYPRKFPFHGDFFGREGLLVYLSCFRENIDLVEFTISDVQVDRDGKSAMIKGHEKVRSKANGVEIVQPWVHRIRFGPYGKILRLKIEIDTKMAKGNWNSMNVIPVYSEETLTAMRSTRALSISMHDFTVYNVIGKGGFGTVVSAVKKSDGQIYALKILEKGKMTKYDIESSFTEMRVAQNIHHPFIAGLRIAFQSTTKLFLGMHYYNGGDLFHHMSKGATSRISPQRAKFYTAELVLGIHHLHKHDILYRDIKPENVMIDADGHIALVDFGLAKLHVSEFKGAKTMAGSPQYTAPELLLPKAKRSYGKAADWWSLGILLYEMSVGKSPFFDSNIEKMYHKIQNDPLMFPSNPETSPEVQDLLLGLLRKDPHQRYGTNSISDILDHPFFVGIDWDLLLQKKIEAPWKPHLTSTLDVKYVDTEFTELDVSDEVLSPTDKASKGMLFDKIEKMFVPRNAKKAAGPVQDPTFKDFTYYCQDPNALVDATSLVDELHKPNTLDADLNADCAPTANGTPLSSFIANDSSSDNLGRSPDVLPVDPRLNPPYNSTMPHEVEHRKNTPPPLYVPPLRSNPLPPKPKDARTPSPNVSTASSEEKDDSPDGVVRRNPTTTPVFFRNSFRHSFRAPTD